MQLLRLALQVAQISRLQMEVAVVLLPWAIVELLPE